MKPPKRERRQRVIGGTDSVIVCGERWTVMEKQQLLDGLRSYGPLKLEQIQKEFLPRRQMVDIKNYIKNLKMRFRNHQRLESDIKAPKAPIEIWLAEAEGLTQKEHDYSFNLAEAFSIFGNLEPHDMLPHGHAPNWSEVYLYLSALLRGAEPPEPSPSNAMILLDLVDSLAEDLCSQDIRPQRRLMQLKANLLQLVMQANNKTEAYAKIQAALEKDPLENDEQAGFSNSQVRSVSGAKTTSTNQTVTSQNANSASANQSQEGTSSGNQSQEGTSSANQSQEGTSSANQNTNGVTNQNSRTIFSANRRSPARPPPVKRSPLYTLNPLCIPIKYLKLSAGRKC